MDLIQSSIRRPAAVIVGVILVIFFGLISLTRMPYQLTPTVVEPVITITTTWAGATPYEVERDIIEEQEKVLKGIPGLAELESESFNSRGRVTLRFEIGVEVNDALLRVSNKLDEVRSYPDGADKPIISAAGASASPVVWMVIKTVEGNTRPVYTYRTFFENEVRQYLERVPGVADLFIGGGVEREMHVRLKPEKLSAHHLTINDVVRALQSENVNISAGSLALGRRDYRIRTVAQFQSPQEIEQVVIKSTGQRRVTVGDVAEVGFGYEKLTATTMHNGRESVVCGVIPESGANILELTDRVEAAVKQLNQTKLKAEGIYLDWAYDQRPYILGAIGLVKQNIVIGGILAVFVLLIFLGSLASTMIAALAIPVSAVGAFIVLGALGRSLNVVSLAGISFAIGMLVDNAIVVLENIDRHYQMGKKPVQAALDGAHEVWGAVLASTLTTIAVFLPVVFIEEEAGQLFKDIALAVTSAVGLSFLISVSVIPMLASRLLTLRREKKRVSLIQRLGGLIGRGIMWLVALALRNWATRLATVFLFTGAALTVSYLLMPKMEYLPQGNRNLVLNILIPPPGLSYKERADIGRYIYRELDPYFKGEHRGFPKLASVFYIGSDSFMLFGASTEDEQRAGEMIPIFRRVMAEIPGVFGISQQAGIFQTRLGRGRTISVDVSGPDLARLITVAGTMFGRLRADLNGAQIRPVPSLDMLYPEVKFKPYRDRLRAVGMSASDLGVALDVLLDGRKVAEFKEEGKKSIDLVLKSVDDGTDSPESLNLAKIVTPSGDSVPVFALAKMDRTNGVTLIRHLEQLRTITLEVSPPADLPLEEAIERIENQVIPGLKKQGLLDGLTVRLSGAADKLTVTRQALQWNFVVAAVITYLLMSALFGNFLYPVIILFTVPLAAAGGFIGLGAIDWLVAPQALDIVTMLGFVILIGVVVNNAILIVHQSLNNMRLHHLPRQEAVLEAVKTRLRPIYMSAATSVFGMLPLVVAPGPGSELYRGLGSVVLGGLAVSTVFTIFVIPSLLRLALFMEPEQAAEQEEGPISIDISPPGD